MPEMSQLNENGKVSIANYPDWRYMKLEKLDMRMILYR